MVQDTLAWEDRRMFERFVARFPVKFQDSNRDYGTDVSLRNASAQGAKITTKERLYLNDHVNLEVELSDSKSPMILKGQVVWVRKEEPDVWDAGLKFHNVDLAHISRLYKFVSAPTSD